MRDFNGNFETHVTAASTDRVDDLRIWAMSRALKFTHIVLARGETCSQPMLTFHGNGSLENAITKAEELAKWMTDAGFSASRYKIEFDIENPGVPVTDDDAGQLAAGQYFEFHVKSERLPHGYIQMDVVFGEEMWVPPIEAHFPNFESGSSLLAAGVEQSLAWKLLWLSTDSYPEGKDLYDAVLLAEKCPISFELLKTAYSDNGRIGNYTLREDLPMEWHVEWEDFHIEYPNVEGTVSDWKRRLREALKPAYKVL